METIDDEVLEHGLDFIERKTGEGTPWFMWFNATHMHLHAPEAGERRPGRALAVALPRHDDRPHHDWLATFLAAAGEPDVVDKLKAGHPIGDTTYKVHVDGYDLLPYLTGESTRARARVSSTSRTTATSSRFASTTGRSSSWSSVRREPSRSGQSRSFRCAFRNCSICAPTPSNGQT
jgi:hypothetical protein